MKNISICLVLFAFINIQCSKSEDPGSASLSLSASTLALPGIASNTASFTVNSNATWTITSDETWLSVNPETGSGNLSVNITSEKNPDGLPRTCTLTVSATGASPKTIVITQVGIYEPIFSVSSPSGEFKGAILKIDANNGNTLQTISIATDPNFEDGLAYDGNVLYYINGRTDAVGLNKIIVIDPMLGQPVDTFNTEFPQRMDALAINKKNLYVLDFLQKKIYMVSIDTKTIAATITPAFPEAAIGGMAFGGSRGTLFVSSFTFGDASTNKVYEINASTGAVVNSFSVPISPFGLAYSETAHVLYITTGEPFDAQKSIYVLNADTGAVIKKFTGSGSALAADESGL
jgi:outer membrane protein assembly factor BamB